MAASTSVPLTKASQEAFIAYYTTLQNFQNIKRDDFRSRMEEVDKQYQREVDSSYEHQASKVANKAGDPSKMQNIVVPVVMPQVETAVSYQTSVFLTGVPIFGVVSDPGYMNEALQLETIIDSQATKGGWTSQLMQAFRNGFKHNFGPIEVDWSQEVTYAVETSLEADTAAASKSKKILWSGNKIKALDPYNTFVDTRCNPVDVPEKGEFAGYTELVSRIELKKRIEELPDKIISNIVPAFESGRGASVSTTTNSMNYYVPDINPVVPVEDYKGETNWMQWARLSTASKNNIDYKDSYDLTTLYCRILPSEFDMRIPNRNIPQIYKLLIVNHQHIIYCEKQTNAHNLIPILIMQPHEDGLGYQTKSLANNAQPFQQVTSSLMNSIVASRRRAISDRTLFDPSRISSAAINSANPSAKIPVRPAAYGKNIAEAVYAFPYREDQASFSMQNIQQLLGLANQLSGQNQASQGQFVKGNKTLHEFESVMSNANGRDQMVSILLEAQVFSRIKLILKTNILQYQGGVSVYNRDKQRMVKIDPVKLRKAILEFKISDGLVPSTKILNSDIFSVALQVLGSSPQIAQGYNIAPLFSYLMKSQGANLTDFEKSQEQMMYEQALAQWQSVAQMLVEKGGDPASLPPQPTPDQFNYNVSGSPQQEDDDTENPAENTQIDME